MNRDNIDFGDYNSGCIVGNSGSGKTTIINEYFKDKIVEPKFDNRSVIENFDCSTKQTIELLSAVGFSSPMEWLKPYHLLSNGQRMRVDLAYAISLDQDVIVFDEYTSVVDRDVAKVGSLAIQKYLRKFNKKFIAVSCHYDILEWLQPDWVIDTTKQIFEKKNLLDPKLMYQFINKKDFGIFLKNFII